MIPTLALTSSAGAVPQLVSVTGDATVYAGMWIHFQRASDSGFTTSVVNYYAMMDGASWDAGSETYPSQAPFGLADFVQPTGTYFERVRFETSPGDSTTNSVGPWSNSITDTIIASTAVLASTNGVNKSQYLNISNGNKSWIHNANVGVICLVRATIAAQSVKWHAEFKYDGIAATGTWSCGVTDSGSVTSFVGFVQPGSSSVPGLTCSMNSAGTQLVVYSNGSSSSPSLPGGTIPVVGDAVVLEGDKSANQVKVYYYRQATGISTLMATVTLTGVYIPAAWFVCGGGATGTGTLATSDSGTFNAGASTFLMALTSGYSIYG